MADYHFTYDWFSGHIPKWQVQLAALMNRPCRLLEIGSFEGRSAVWLADNVLSDPAATLTCIDPWTYQSTFGLGGEELFDLNRGRCARSHQIIKIKGYSIEVLPTLQAGFDFAYIDGSHEARDCLSDWVYTLPLMKSGGLVCFDDYQWIDPTYQTRILPRVAIDCVLEFWADVIEVVDKDRQVWVRVRK